MKPGILLGILTFLDLFSNDLFVGLLFQRFGKNIEFSCMHEACCSQLSPVKRICVFEHSVMTNFNCACLAIQRGQGSGFLSEGSS